MKKVMIIVLCLILISCLFVGCKGKYEKTELTKDNYLEYFEWGSPNKIIVSGNKCTPKNYNSNELWGYLVLKSDKIKGYYYEDVEVTMNLNLYYGLTSVNDDSIPTETYEIKTKLTYVEGPDNVTYQCGFNLVNCWAYFYTKSGEVEKQTYKMDSKQISAITYNEFTETWNYNDYYREIEIVSITGVVKTGGLVHQNAHSCD